ncbi:hypothetical protein AWENTII_007918 [Aspergillus wentii]
MEKDSVPSPAQLALAMAVVKQKPTGVDIKEHIMQIREFIKETKDSHRSSSQDKFFDSVSFWQQAFEKSEAEQIKLLDRIYELEQRNEALLSKLQTGSTTHEEKTQETNKRKANTNKNTAARKRAKTQAFNQKAPLTDDQMGGDNAILNQIEYLEESTGPFMRHFYVLQSVLQKRPNRSIIVKATANLSKTAANELLNASHDKKAAGRSKTAILIQSRKPKITAVLRSVEHAFQLLYQGLEKLIGPKQSMLEIGQVIYHLVSLFDAAMKALQQNCKTKAEQSTSTKANAKSTKNKQTTKPKKSVTALAPPKADDELATQITRLLGTMALSLDLTCPEHQEILEGFLFTLLTRVGVLLSLFVFQDLQLRPDLQIDPAHLPLPKGLMEAGLDDKSLCAAHLEAKHLIWLLERVLASLDSTPSCSLPPETTSFVFKIKQQLQSTLLQAVFGADSVHFHESLQYPMKPDALELDQIQTSTQTPEQTTPDWFIQEVWRLLGWDMLMSDDLYKKK